MGRADKSIRINFENIDVVDFLEELNIRNVRDEGLEVFYSCPFPGHTHEDSNPSASMKQGTTVAYCFGCGWRGNALKFLADFEGVSPLVAARWIRQRFGDDFQEPEGAFLEEIDTILAGTKKREDTIPGVLDDYESLRRQIDWSAAQEFRDRGEQLTVPLPIHYMLDRGFSPEVLEKFEIGFDAISQRIVIPYRNADGQLVGFKARAYLDGQVPRYWTLGGPEYGFEPMNVSQHLWGLNKAVGMKHVIIVEGELNALSMRQREWAGAVGISGKYLSDSQVKLIVSHFDRATIIMDEIADQVVAAEKLQPYMPVFIVPEHDKDPAEMSDSELERLVSDRKGLLEASLPTA